MTPEQQRQADCPHPKQYLAAAEGWFLGRYIRAVRCHLCGATA